MNKEPASEKNWIVKASDTILGPFTIEELAKAVRTKHVGLLDEAKNTSGRWLFVRDLAELQAAISELVNQEDTIERTQTAAHSQVSVTKRLDDDQTPVPVQVPIIPKTTSVTIAAPQQSTTSSSATTGSPVRSYGVKASKEPLPVMKLFVGALVFASLVIGVVLFIQKQTWESEQKKYWTQFQQLYAAKLYSDAYEKLKEYQLEYPDQPTSLTRAGFLFLNPGRELVKAKRAFERSSRIDPKNKDLMIQNLNGLGLVALYEGQDSQARSYFDRALTLEPNNWMTRLNSISLASVQKRWGEAYNLTQQIINTEAKQAYLIQGSMVLLAEQHRDRARLVMMGLLKSLDQSSYLREEMRLLIIRLAGMINDHVTLESQIKAFFDDLPSLQIGFSENPMLDQRWQDWNILYHYCSEITGPTSLEADLLAMQVVCISQVKRWSEAERIVNEGLKRFPNHPHLLIAQLHMLSSMGRWPEIRALMRHQTLVNEPSAAWMFAKSCLEEKNFKCAETYLNPMVQSSYITTPVYELRARMQCRENIYDDCRFSVSQGLTQDPLATGLLRIRYRVEDSL